MTDNAGNRNERSLLSYRVEKLEEAVSEIRNAVKSIDKSLQLLTLIETRSAETSQRLAAVAARVDAIEEELPTLKLARKWVLAVMTSGGAALGAGVLALVVK